jgi:hypothetical protein
VGPLCDALPADLAAQAKNAGGERLVVERSGSTRRFHVGIGPSPTNRLVPAFVEAYRQRRINPRTGRLDGGAGRSHNPADHDGGTLA